MCFTPLTTCTQKALYRVFKDTTASHPVLSKVSASYFYKIWNTRHNDLKVRKVMRFTVCTLCTEFSEIQLRGGSATLMENNKGDMMAHRQVRRQPITATAPASDATAR